MLNEIARTVSVNIELLFNKVLMIASVLVGTLLASIGYPKEVLIFIMWLIVIDLFTKQYAIVRVHQSGFTLRKYFKAWKDRQLTSRELKNGLCVKAMLYFPVLYIANKTSVIPEMIYGETISNILYTLLILVESSSIMENFIMAGHTRLQPILDFIKNKEDEITEISGDDK